MKGKGFSVCGTMWCGACAQVFPQSQAVEALVAQAHYNLQVSGYACGWPVCHFFPREPLNALRQASAR